MRDYISVVGSGFGMLALLDHLLTHRLTEHHIRIFSHCHDQIGEAYKDAPSCFLLNTHVSFLTSFTHATPFASWWVRYQGSTVESPDYLPRAIYGSYLRDVKRVLFEKLRASGNIISMHGPVEKIGVGGEVVQTNGMRWASDVTFLSPGFGTGQKIQDMEHKIASAPRHGVIKIAGSGLSGIDAILLCAQRRPDLTIECHSMSGAFPRIRTAFGKGGPSFLTEIARAPRPTAIACMRAVRRFIHDKDDIRFFNGQLSSADELALASSGPSLWQQALYNATGAYARVFAALSPCDQAFLMRRRSAFIARRVMYPMVNARKIHRLLQDKQLLMIKGSLSEHALAAPTTLRAFHHSDLLARFRRASHLQAHPLGGVRCDMNGLVCSARAIYALGPITNGVKFFTEASGLTYEHARLAVDSAMHYRKYAIGSHNTWRWELAG